MRIIAVRRIGTLSVLTVPRGPTLMSARYLAQAQSIFQGYHTLTRPRRRKIISQGFHTGVGQELTLVTSLGALHDQISSLCCMFGQPCARWI